MIGGRKAEARRALATAEMAASGSGLPIFTDGAGAVLRSCQKKAVKRLKSFARVHLYRGAFQARRPVLIQAELRAALDRSSQVAERIRSTFLELGIALVSTQVLRRHGMMTHRAHLPCFTISAACRPKMARHLRLQALTRSRQRQQYYSAIAWKRASSSWAPLQFT